MLPKQNRVSEKEVALLFQKAKSIRTPFFVARYLPDSVFKCAVIAPKTTAKGAILRNKLRRQWYASIQSVLKNTPLQKGVYAFVLNKEAIPSTSVERIDSILKLFKQLA